MDHYLEVRYEDLLADTEATLRRVCEFIELPYDPAMANSPQRSAIEAELGPVGAWRQSLGDEDLAAFDEVAGPLLAELGYEPSAQPASS